MTSGMIIVLGITLLAVVLLIWEPVGIDVTALLVLVLLVLLQPWTGITPEQAVSGFSNPATLTVLAMLILSEGVRRTGLIQVVARRVSRWVGGSERRQLAATMGMAGPVSGFMNNTPVVALLIPMVNEMAQRGRTSPSRLLIPLSYASMMGGMLTVIGTSTNLLAADLSSRLLGERIGLFEFTHLGAIVFLVGAVYLVFAAPRLLPERVKPEESYVEEFAVQPFLSEVRISEGAPMLDQTVREWLEDAELQVEVLALLRDEMIFEHPYPDKVIREGDVILVHASRRRLDQLMGIPGVELLGAPDMDAEENVGLGDFENLIEVVIPAGSRFDGQTVAEADFPGRYDAYVLALRSGGEVIRERIGQRELRAGDTILVQTTRDGNDRLLRSPEIYALRSREHSTYRREKLPLTVLIVVAVVALAAFEVLPIMISSLAGVVTMLLTGVLRPAEMYRAVEWRVIFLLAGIIPLGIALEQTGAAGLMGQTLAQSGMILPTVAVLWLFYIATGLITEIISNNASVLLMIPVAIETATHLDANPFAFVLAVMFAASTAFLGPIGYQTNLFVYGPGGYRISDFVRIGAPLQLILSIVTVGGIVIFWGL